MLRDVAAGCQLALRAERMAPHFVSLVGQRSPLQIALGCACPFRVELATGDGPGRRGLEQTVAVLDARGEPLPVHGPGFLPHHSVEWSWRLAGGKSPVLQVGEQAATLVVRNGNDGMERFPLRLVPGEIVVLRS